MPVIAQMLKIRAEQPQELFYSNYVDAVWFSDHAEHGREGG